MAPQPRIQYKTEGADRWRTYNPDQPPQDPDGIVATRVHPGDRRLVREQAALYWIWVRIDEYPMAGYTTSVRVSEEMSGWVITDLVVSRTPRLPSNEAPADQAPWLSDGIVTKGRNEAGVTPSILRQLKMSEIRQAVLEEVDKEGGGDQPPRLELALEGLRTSMSSAKRGRRDPLTKARLAASYDALVRLGVNKGIHAELGKAAGKSPSTISAYIRDLRTEGYLTSPGGGKAAGTITDKTKLILWKVGEL